VFRSPATTKKAWRIDSMDRRNFIHGAVGAALLVGSAARAQSPSPADATWPNRPVRFIVPLAAGGGLDFVARVIGDHMTREIGQQIFIENRTGAGGTIGIDTAIKAAPDGYSVLLTNDNVAAAPHVLGLSVDFLNDLLPVALLGRQPQALAVHPSLAEVNSVADLLALVKQKPGMGCATSGVGSNQHVLCEWFKREANVKIDHVPYRGAGQAINDLIAAHVKVAMLGPTSMIPHWKAGTLNLLAQSTAKRNPTLPEIPTFVEAGYKDLVLEAWYGAFAPKGTPPEILSKLNAEMNKALKDPKLVDTFTKGAIEAVGGGTEEITQLARADSEKYARLVKELNIRTN
jgi:tripartite-type tricarboxylate transporter receptor subunit TctC